MLRDLDLNIRYNTGTGQLVRDFYAPCLRQSVEYCRAAGYFTSYGLSMAARGVAGLIHNGGRMRLIASPNLTVEDIEAINRGARSGLDVVAEAAARDIADVASFVAARRLEALTWMVREQLLEIRLAFKSNPMAPGIYHEKNGVFRDVAGNRVAFSGSGNETIGGWEANYESLSVYCSWKNAAEFASAIEYDFERLWSNNCDGITCMDFTEVAESVLRPYTPRSRPIRDPEEEEGAPADTSETGRPRVGLPAGIELRDYQKLAVRNWFDAGGRGVFKMATGSGKTITALAIASNMVLARKSRSVVVVAPYIHLVNQWAAEARAFGFAVVSIHGSSAGWHERAARLVQAIGHAGAPLCLVVTNDGLRGACFQGLMRELPADTLIIGDEVHNLGTSRLRDALPDQMAFRIGLSATPERHGDDSGTARILEYFGKILEPEFTLKQALLDGVLCPYEFKPVRVDFTDGEDEEFQKLSLAIARLAGGADDESDAEESPYKLLVMKRARLVANAQRKLDALRRIMLAHRNDTHMLVYCGSGYPTDLEDVDTRRNIEQVCDILGNELAMRVATFTNETEHARRESLLRSLESGDIQCLIAIRCLDEGVDVPSIRTAVIMASTSNPRQYVQRRGRLLRRSPGKKQALIYDLAVLPCVSGAVRDRAIGSLVRRELRRAYEFGTLANNCGDACKQLVEWGLEYGVTIFDE